MYYVAWIFISYKNSFRGYIGQMNASLVSSSEDTGTFHDIFGSGITPFDTSWISFSKNDYFCSIYIEKLAVLFYFPYNE